MHHYFRPLREFTLCGIFYTVDVFHIHLGTPMATTDEFPATYQPVVSIHILILPCWSERPVRPDICTACLTL